MNILIDLLLIGALAGLLSGLLGVGGGVVVVPSLAYLFEYTHSTWAANGAAMHIAVASSLMIMAPTTVASAYSHYRQGSVRWDVWKKWIIGLCVGAALGALFATMLSTDWLKHLFAVFLIFVVLKLLTGKSLPAVPLQPRFITLTWMGVAVGVVSGLLGVGGGGLMVPLLIGMGYKMTDAAGTSTASTAPLAMVGAISFMMIGWSENVSIPWATGYVYWPAVLVVGIMGVIFAPIGVRLSTVISSKWLKRILAVVLLAVSIRMFI